EETGVLAGKTRLILVPHAELHYLPFAALLGGSGRGRFLIERYEVAVTPSASVWLALGDRPAGPVASGTLVLAPRPDVLPASRREAAAVGRLGGGTYRFSPAARQPKRPSVVRHRGDASYTSRRMGSSTSRIPCSRSWIWLGTVRRTAASRYTRCSGSISRRTSLCSRRARLVSVRGRSRMFPRGTIGSASRVRSSTPAPRMSWPRCGRSRIGRRRR